MRIVKEGADAYLDSHWDNIVSSHISISVYKQSDTIEINLDDFVQWYYDKWYTKEAGWVWYDSVPHLIREWLASLTGEGK
jgi:hypothetical protein